MNQAARQLPQLRAFPVCARALRFAIAFTLSFFALPFSAPASAGFLGIEFDADDCVDKYTDKMRLGKQRNLMRDMCRVKHDSGSSRTEKRFAKCVLDLIYEISDDSQGKRVLQSCSAKTGEEVTYKRLIGRFSTQPNVEEFSRQTESNRNTLQGPRTITILDSDGTPRLCMIIGDMVHCP